MWTPPTPPPLQVVWMSGLPSEWGSPPSVDPPDSVVARTHDYLDLLGNKILGYKVCVCVGGGRRGGHGGAGRGGRSMGGHGGTEGGVRGSTEPGG